MRVALLAALTLLVTGCDFVESLARGGGSPSAYAQIAMMDTAGVVARRVAAALPGGLDARLISMLPDGRSGVTIDSDMGDLVLYELASGAVTRLTHNFKPFWPGYAPGSVSVSPDGRHVAYPWEERVDTLANGLIGIRVLDLEGGPPRVIYQGGDANEESTLVGGWSPDGRSLSAVIQKGDQTAKGEWSVVTIDVGSPDGPTVRSLGWRVPGRIEYSPDGRFLAYDRPPSPEDDARDVYVLDLARNREFEVVASPADDRLLGWMPGSGELLFQSDRSGTTGVWTQRLDVGRAAGDPVLVHPDFWGAAPRSITADGRLYFAIQSDGYQTMVADVDLGANALRNVEPLVPGSETGGLVSHFKFFEDRNTAAVVSRPSLGSARYVLSVRSEMTREIREYPLPIQVVYAGNPRFSRDGNTAAVAAEILGGLPLPPGTAWNAIIRVDLLTGRTEIDEVLLTELRLLPDGRSALIRMWEQTDPESGVSTYSIRDLARHTERVLFQSENSVVADLTPDGQSVLTLAPSFAGPREAFLAPLDGSSGPRPISDSPLLLPAGGEVRFDPMGGALIAIFEEVERTYAGEFTAHSVEALTWERIPLDGSQRTTTTVPFPDAFPALALLRGSTRPTVSPGADRILYVTGGPAFELWVLEGLPGGAPTSVGDR